MLRRIRCPYVLAPVLLLVLALGTGTAREDLNRLETVAIRRSGHVFNQGYVWVVFHARPVLLWILRPEGNGGDDVLLTLRLERTGDGLKVTALDFLYRRFADMVLPAGQGERLVRRLLSDYRSVSLDRHPLALFHERLLGQQVFVEDRRLHLVDLQPQEIPRTKGWGTCYGRRLADAAADGWAGTVMHSMHMGLVYMQTR